MQLLSMQNFLNAQVNKIKEKAHTTLSISYIGGD